MVYDSISGLLMNIGLFGGAITFGLLGILLGITRGMTKNSEIWAITFSSFAWLLAIMIPSTPWALSIFLAGTIGIMISFMPTLEKMQESNIFTIAIITLVINFLVLFGTGAYAYSLAWQANTDIIDDDLATILGTETGALNGNIPGHGLCRPDDPSCSNEIEKGVIDTLAYDVIAPLLKIGAYLGKLVQLAGAAVSAPFLLAFFIQDQVTNAIIVYLIALLIGMWNAAIMYKIARFVFGKRG